MAEFFWLNDEQWSKLSPLLPNDMRGVPQVHDRLAAARLRADWPSGKARNLWVLSFDSTFS